MARYFFDRSDGEQDVDGVELRDIAEAERQAIIAASEHLRDIGFDGSFPWTGETWSINVRNEAGDEALCLSYSLKRDYCPCPVTERLPGR